jgi:uncharacterized protein (TIGR02246 family)
MALHREGDLRNGLALAILCLWASGPAFADDRPPEKIGQAKERAVDAEAIRKASAAFVDNFARHDAKAIAAACTKNCEYFDEHSGEAFRGQHAIEKAFGELFAHMPHARISADIRSIRFPAQDLAVVEGQMELRPGGGHLPRTSQYTTFYVREAGEWKVAFGREWPEDRQKLEDLAWLIGDWSATPPGRKVEMHFAWNDAKTAITCRFKVTEKDRDSDSGTQTIRLDPRTGQIRSSTLHAEGGHGQAHWYRDGDSWILESSGVQADGTDTSSIAIMNRVGEDAFTWRSIDRVIGGETLPPTNPVKVVRVKGGE